MKHTLIPATLLLASLGVAAQEVTLDEQAVASNEQPVAERDIETIYVIGTRSSLENLLSPGVVSVAFPDEVKGEHKSLPDILDQIAGVYVRRLSGTGQYTTTSIRGSAPSQVNIYIDGVPYNTSSEAAVDLSTLPISNVERVEVYRGSTPARFSGAPLGGAINIVTKAPESFGGSASFGARSFGGQQGGLSFSAPLLGGSLLLSADTEESEGNFTYRHAGQEWARDFRWSDGSGLSMQPWDVDLPVQRTRQSNNFERNNLLINWRTDTLNAKASWTYMDRYMPANIQRAGWASQVDTINDRHRQQQEDFNIALGWNDSFGKLDLSLTYNYSQQDKLYRHLDVKPNVTGTGSRWSSYLTERYGIMGDATYTLGEDSAVRQHLELHVEYLEEQMANDANHLSYSSRWLRYYKRDRSAVQLQNSITIAPLGDLQIAPVFRMEKVEGPPLSHRITTRRNPFGDPDGDFGWKRTWGLNLKKELGNWQLFTNFGTYNRYPNFYEIYGDGIFVVPNWDSTYSIVPLLRETGDNIDLGFGWNGRLLDSATGGFRATFFERETENTITLYSTPVGAKYINSGTTLTRGLELEGNLVWAGRADLQFALTAQEGHYIKGTYYVFGGIAVAERVDGDLKTLQAPDLVVSTRLNLHFLGGALTTFGEVHHVGKKYVSQGSGYWSYEEPLTTLGLGGHFQFSEGFKFSAGVDDVFNKGPEQELGHSHGRPQGIRGPDVGQEQQYSGPIPRNVYYPQQGRTFYATLAYRF